MKNSRLRKLLRSLRQEEFRRLGKFIRSPFFNYTRAQVQLYEYLKKDFPDFADKRLEKKRVWKKIYPGQPFNENKYWRLCTNFTKLVEKFLVTIQLESEQGEARKILIRSLGKRNLYGLYEKETHSYLHAIAEKPHRDVEYYSDKARLQFDYFFHPLTPKLTHDDEALIDLMESTDKQFVLAKLRIGSELKNRESILAKKYQMRFLDEIFNESKRGFLSDNELFKIYDRLFRLYAEKEETNHFFDLKNALSASRETLRNIDLSLMMTQMINYAIQRVNTGDINFSKETLDLYKLSLQFDLIVNNGTIEEAVFGNIVSLGCYNKDYVWVEQFVSDYSSYLDLSIRGGTVIYSNAAIHFSKGEFDKTIFLLTQHHFSGYHQTRVRLMVVRAAFEKFITNENNYGFLLSQIDSFEKFLRRDGLQKETKRISFLNFLQFLKKAANISLGKKHKRETELLLDKIKNEKYLVFRSWLVQKVTKY
ncbi:MAG: hypothetical protein AAFZ15_02270 [Bacteroidota bacterium]